MNDKEKQAWEAFKKELLEQLMISAQQIIEVYEHEHGYQTEEEPAPPSYANLQVWDKDRFTEQDREANIKQILADILKIRNQF